MFQVRIIWAGVFDSTSRSMLSGRLQKKSMPVFSSSSLILIIYGLSDVPLLFSCMNQKPMALYCQSPWPLTLYFISAAEKK